MGAGTHSRGGSERWINVYLSSPSVGVAATCVCLEKGRYTALQSEPINRPSSGRHAGGPPHKDSPYGATPRPTTHPLPSASSGGRARTHSCWTGGALLFLSLFKAAATRYCQQAPALEKGFLSKRFPEEKGRWARGRAVVGGLGVRGRVNRAASRLHLLSLSNYRSISPPRCLFLPPFLPPLLHCNPSSSPSSCPPCGEEPASGRVVASPGLGSRDNSNCPGHANRWHFSSFDTYFKSRSASELH